MSTRIGKLIVSGNQGKSFIFIGDFFVLGVCDCERQSMNIALFFFYFFQVGDLQDASKVDSESELQMFLVKKGFRDV